MPRGTETAIELFIVSMRNVDSAPDESGSLVRGAHTNLLDKLPLTTRLYGDLIGVRDCCDYCKN